ncbi:MAG: glycerophosphodiester phosphodiesterase [Sandaracinaceae bacterium]
MHRYLAPSPVAFAHRGGAARWPENTITAFEGAVGLGYRYIETDVHRTKDGAIVCFHDATVDRTTDGTGPVFEHTRSELERLDAGYRFTPDGRQFPFRSRGCRIPTLEEAFAIHPELRLNVEIKQREPAMERALWDEIDRLGVHDRILVAAAHDPLMDRFRAVRRDPRIPTSPGIRGVVRFWAGARSGLHRLERYPFDALQVPARYRGLTVVDARFVRAAHRHGIRVHVWTVDAADEMHRLLDLGVDGVMTDEPERLAQVFASRGLPLAGE